jgi:hypothetical protein
MDDDKPTRAEAGISTPAMDVIVAVLLLCIGVLVVIDSYRLGSSWGDDGPQSGYFPFYIGLLLCISSAATLAQVAFAEWKRRGQFKGVVAEHRRQFVAWGAAKQVLAVLLPAVAYVVLVQLAGIYVASAAYIALFMVWLGKYTWLRGAVVGLAVSASLFLMFEVWFKVPLYKGVYDALSWLGY